MLSKGNPLHWVGMTVFRHHNFFEEFKINETTFSNFLESIEKLYRLENPYHNSIHAADVVCLKKIENNLYFYLIFAILQTWTLNSLLIITGMQK